MGLYIHIPFCRSRCAYCDFFSTTREEEKQHYVQALCREIAERRHEIPHTRVRTIYIGGGTPSLLSPTLLQQIFDAIYANYDVEDGAEVTLEMNPDDVGLLMNDECISMNITSHNNQYSSIINPKSSINRISLGVQTFDDQLLHLIRRRHDSQTAIQAVRRLQADGIRNISIDLIYGLPGQTLAQWEHDLDTAFSLGIQHLSAYALSYEEGTPLTRWRDEGRIREVPEELSVAMYQRLCQRAREAGFEHYEISNFALPSYHSRHNSSYWTGAPYLGFGPGAHSYDGLRTRRANLPSLDTYLSFYSSPRGGQEGAVPFSCETLTTTELHNEAVMCGLRTREGIDLPRFLSRFGQSRLDALLANAAPHLHASRLILEQPTPDTSQSSPLGDHRGPLIPPHRLRLAESALMISDSIMSDLMAS